MNEKLIVLSNVFHKKVFIHYFYIRGTKKFNTYISLGY